MRALSILLCTFIFSSLRFLARRQSRTEGQGNGGSRGAPRAAFASGSLGWTHGPHSRARQDRGAPR